MITDNKGKVFGKLNIIDLLIIFIVLIAIVSTVFKFSFSSQKEASVKKNDIVECMLKVENVRMYTINAFDEGVDVYDESTAKVIGKIKKFEYEPSMQYLTKNDGSVVKSVMPERYNAYITLECPVKSTKEGYILNGNNLITNLSTLRVSTNKVEVVSKVINIKASK